MSPFPELCGPAAMRKPEYFLVRSIQGRGPCGIGNARRRGTATAVEDSMHRKTQLKHSGLLDRGDVGSVVVCHKFDRNGMVLGVSGYLVEVRWPLPLLKHKCGSPLRETIR